MAGESSSCSSWVHALNISPPANLPTLIVPLEKTLSPDIESRYKAITEPKVCISLPHVRVLHCIDLVRELENSRVLGQFPIRTFAHAHHVRCSRTVLESGDDRPLVHFDLPYRSLALPTRRPGCDFDYNPSPPFSFLTTVGRIHRIIPGYHSDAQRLHYGRGGREDSYLREGQDILEDQTGNSRGAA